MDPSAPSVPKVQEQDAPVQPASQTPVQPVTSTDQTSQPAPTQPVQPSQQQKEPMTISVNKEAGPAVIVTESADAGENDENDIKVAPQEANVIGPQGGAEAQETVELQPAVPEVAIENTEVEKIVEATPDQEKPDIPKALSDAGVTHSGPGIIAVPQNNFGIKEIPVSYQQAAVEEKQTELHESKHWLMGVVMYVWRRINPELGKEKKTKQTAPVTKKEPEQTLEAKPEPVVNSENSENQKEETNV